MPMYETEVFVSAAVAFVLCVLWLIVSQWNGSDNDMDVNYVRDLCYLHVDCL